MMRPPPAARHTCWPALVFTLVLALAAGVMSGGARAAGAAELRLVTWNVENGVGSPGSAAFEAVRETLDRLRPDIIAFQEVSAQSTIPSDAAHFADLRALLAALGFPGTRRHLATAGDGFETQPYVAGDFGNSSQSLAIASRHPIRRAVQIGRGIGVSREMTRYPLAVTIEVAGSGRDLTVVAVHFKQGGTKADEFRRGIEALRVSQFLLAEGLSGSTDHIVVAGDMNEELNEPQTGSFPTSGIGGAHVFSDGSALPVGYRLGSDVPDPLRYSVFPTSAFAAAGLSVVPATQTDGRTDRTYAIAGDARLDYVLTSDATRHAGAVRAEVYHSGREPAGDGLPKRASLPDPMLSLIASDHLPVVADFVIEAVPALVLTLPAEAVDVGFEPAGAPLQASVAISAARLAPLTVTIAPYRGAPLRAIPPVVFPAGEITAAFPLEVAGSPFVPDRRITLIARAEGFRDGLGTLAIRGTGVGGPVIISQYTETPSGSAPKAIEIMNVGSRAIAFAAEPLEIRYFASGASTGAREIFAESGRLPAGAVVVIGDGTTAQHLIARGLLRATASQVANAQTGAIFTDTGEPDGRAVYIKRGFLFNGDDALEVRLNGRRCDVFGTIGHDPGSAWSAAGVSTANQNLSRRRTAIASSSGWTNPSLLFETAGTSLAAALDGFGVAPPLDDPYAEWAAARGLSGAAAEIDADPDANGLPNGIDFVFGDAGPRLSPPGPVAGQWQWQLDAQARHSIGTLRWGVATFDSPAGWVTRWEQPSPAMPGAPNAGEFRPLTLHLPASDAAAGLARVFVVRP